MDRPLRLATAVTFASLFGAAILVALRDVKAGNVMLGATGGVQTSLSIPLFVATLVLLALGLGYLTAAAMFAARWIAVGSTLLITGLIAWTTGLLGVAGLLAVMPDWARAVCWALLALIWMLMLAVLTRPAVVARSIRIRLMVIIASCAIFGAFFVVLAFASVSLNGLSLFPLSVHSLMTDVALLSIPLLRIAAVDFAEWGQLSGERLAFTTSHHVGDDSSADGGGVELRAASKVPGWWRIRVVPTLVCLALIVIGWSALPGSVLARLIVVGEAVLILLVLLAVFLGIGRAARVPSIRWPRSLGFAVLFSVLAVSTWAGGAVTASLSGAFSTPQVPTVSAHGDYTAAANVRSYSGASGFTVLLQGGWAAETKSSVDVITSFVPAGTRTVLTAVEIPGKVTAVDFATQLKLTTRGTPQHDGAWLRLEIAPTGGGDGAIWTQPLSQATQPQGARSFVFYGLTTGANYSERMRALEAIVRSFRAADATPAKLSDVVPGYATAAHSGSSVATTATAVAQRQDDLVQTIGIGFDLLVSILAIVLLLVFGRRWPISARVGVLLYGVVTAFTIVSFGGAALRQLFGTVAVWPGLGEARLLIGVGLFGLVALVVGARRGARRRAQGSAPASAPWTERLPGALSALGCATLVLYVMDLLYTQALGADQVAAWAAVIILVAIGWDITMSGESLTNGSSRFFPRSTRVMGFFGYAILLAGTIVYFSGQHTAVSANTRLADNFFEPEAITQAALFRFALPVMVLLFLFQLFGRRTLPTVRIDGQS